MNSCFQRATICPIQMHASILTAKNPPTKLKRRRLPPPRTITGTERRRINPNSGLIKLGERYADFFISRFVYPLLGHIWSPYCWLLHRRFRLAETRLAPARWPRGIAPLRLLLMGRLKAGCSDCNWTTSNQQLT